MDGEHRRRAQRRVLRDVGRGQAGVPVVRMDDVGDPLRVQPASGEVGGDPAEQRETAVVVGPVVTVGPDVGIAGAPVEEGGVDHIGHATVAGQVAAAQRHQRGAEKGAQRGDQAQALHALQDLHVAGKHDAGVDADAGQCGRQRADHVGEAAGLDERQDLGGDLEDAQRLRSFHALSSRASIWRVTRVTPFWVRRKRRASSAGSSPITRPSGMQQPWSSTQQVRRAWRPTSTSGRLSNHDSGLEWLPCDQRGRLTVSAPRIWPFA